MVGLCVIPAKAGIQAPLYLLECCCGTPGYQGNMESSYFLDSRLRGNDTPHPAVPKALPAFPTRGEAISFGRLKCYKTRTSVTVYFNRIQ